MKASIGHVLRAMAVLALALAGSSMTVGAAIAPGIYPHATFV